MYTPEKIKSLNALRLGDVKPLLRQKCEAVIALANSEGFTLLVTCGYRSNAEQDKLYLIGRRVIFGERKVTNARAGQSNHNNRQAVDFAFAVAGAISWDEKLYENLERWTRAVGLHWGGAWKFRDLPHVEL